MSKVSLKGRVAFVSGASAGIGEATAKMLASNGVNLILAARRIDKLKSIASDLSSSYGVLVHAIELDFSDKDAIITSLSTLPSGIEGIDILVNNAGLALGRDIYYEQRIEDAITMLRVNCEGLITLTHVVLPYLLKSKFANIINVGSVAADTAYAGGAIYCATKSFVEQFSDSLRIELMDKPINVCVIKPGLVNTEFSVVRFGGNIEKARSTYDGFDPLYAEDIADNIEYVLTRKPHVQIASITTLASAQGAATLVHRR